MAWAGQPGPWAPLGADRGRPALIEGLINFPSGGCSRCLPSAIWPFVFSWWDRPLPAWETRIAAPSAPRVLPAPSLDLLPSLSLPQGAPLGPLSLVLCPRSSFHSSALRVTPSFGCFHTGPGALPDASEGSVRMFQRWAGLNTFGGSSGSFPRTQVSIFTPHHGLHD